jgi:hypothetical protein
MQDTYNLVYVSIYFVFIASIIWLKAIGQEKFLSIESIIVSFVLMIDFEYIVQFKLEAFSNYFEYDQIFFALKLENVYI